MKLAQIVYMVGGIAYFAFCIYAVLVGSGNLWQDAQSLFIGTLGLLFGLLIALLIGKYRHKKKR